MRILCLTGWQQEKNALATIAPDALHFDYAAYDNVETVFQMLPKTPDVAIGWSLGGQLLVRAVAGRHIRPEKLILLAAPFQCIADAHFPQGMRTEDFNAVKSHYVRNPEAAVAQFQALVAMGDKYPRRILKAIRPDSALWRDGKFWLDELGRTSCRELDFSEFPETIILHGEYDKVIHPASAKEFSLRLPSAKVFWLPDRGHALHIEGKDYLLKLIGENHADIR